MPLLNGTCPGSNDRIRAHVLLELLDVGADGYRLFQHIASFEAGVFFLLFGDLLKRLLMELACKRFFESLFFEKIMQQLCEAWRLYRWNWSWLHSFCGQL